MIDKRLLRDRILVKKTEVVGDFGEVRDYESLDVGPVRFDRSITVSGTDNSKSQDKVGVIYIYPKFVDVDVDDSWLGARIIDGYGIYTVTGYRPNYLNGKVFSYEVEVI